MGGATASISAASGTWWSLTATRPSSRPSSGAPQDDWLKADLAANNRPCIGGNLPSPPASFPLPECHRVSTRPGPGSSLLGPPLRRRGRLHSEWPRPPYERFQAPKRPDGTADSTRMPGIHRGHGRQGSLPLPRSHPNSEVRNGDTFGVIELP